jgi:hypothetical protein
MNWQDCRNAPGKWKPIEGTATKFDLRDGQYGPYALGTVRDSTGEDAKVLFSSKDNAEDPKDNKPLPDAGCLNRPAVWVGLYDANKQQYRVLFNYYTGPERPPHPNATPEPVHVPVQKEVDWDAKELREKRGYAIRDAALLVTTLAEVSQNANGCSPELVQEIAEMFVTYVYNGPQDPRDMSQGEPSRREPTGSDLPF